MAILPPDTRIPCFRCEFETELSNMSCPRCGADFSVIVCPACSGLTPDDTRCCTNCGRELPAIYQSLTQLEIRELFLVETMLRAHQVMDALPRQQREEMIAMYKLHKRRLLKEITDEEHNRGQIDWVRNTIERRHAQRRQGCASQVLIAAMAFTVLVVVLNLIA
jgi:predicted amidophosphoribosyltransferase